MINKLTLKQKQVIARIQNSIPKGWLENVVSKKPFAPVTMKIITKGLADPDVSNETKAKLITLRDSGFVNKVVDVENNKYVKLISDYVDKEVKKAIKRGELPKKINNGKNTNSRERISSDRVS